ncbi:MAG TPA: hypothetical protein VHY58_02710 [Streptosporangiaceae bacterium]|nr:hypothetical protein [Streptosporangiaceae bacterium]
MRIPGIAELLRPVSDGLILPDQRRQATGREGHTQKITVYLSAEELLDLEHARLRLRGVGVSVDRGRLVREAIAILLADLDAHGEESVLATRLQQRDLHEGALQQRDLQRGDGNAET